MPWRVAALLAAAIWGVHYPLIDRALQTFSPISVLIVTTLPIILFAPVFYPDIARDYTTFVSSSLSEKAWLLSLMITSFTASYLLYTAIGTSNATYASLIEITYPIFVAFFALFILKENHFNPSVLLGGGFIMVGTAIIILKA